MAALTDESIGLANETTAGTYVAPTRFYEWSDGSYEWSPNTVQGAGLRVGSQVARSGRRVRPTASGKVELTVEAISKGMGLLWESCLGVNVSTLVSAATYQQNATLATGTTLPSRTLQVGGVQADGTVLPVSFTGCTVSDWELDLSNEIATLKTTFDAANVSTAQTYAAPSYPSAPSLFHHANATATLGGTVTAPTTTALATGGTAVVNVRSFKLTGANPLVDDRFNFGGGGRKARQLRGGLTSITGEITVELTDTVVRDAFLADTEMPLTLTITGGALSTGLETLQVVLPAVKFDGALPPRSDSLAIITAPFTVLDNLTAAQPIWICHRTADAAI